MFYKEKNGNNYWEGFCGINFAFGDMGDFIKETHKWQL